MNSINISSSLYDYDVQFIDDVKTEVRKLCENSCCTFVIDKNVYELYSDYFELINIDLIYFVDAVESNKNIETCLELIAFWQKIKLKKNWKIICFGGGITQDITTFASNIYLRNIDWYFFPTTLLAMSDSCIGGKCGINLGEYKNQLGVFYPPKKIFICEKFLSTLSRTDYINGWGELLKFSLTENSSFYEKLSKENKYIPCANINEYIHDGLTVKKNIIEADEFDSDLRRILNYGHSFGHAIEAYSNNKIPHGMAVIWGIDVVNYISYRLGILEESAYLAIKRLIKTTFLQDEIKVDSASEIIRILSTDKKVKNNTVYLILLEKISKLIIKPFEIDENLELLLENYLDETHEYYCH